MAETWKSNEIHLRDGVTVDVTLQADGSITQGIVAGEPLAQDLTLDKDAEVQALIVALQTALNRKRAQRAQ